jgi:hypothetical protein
LLEFIGKMNGMSVRGALFAVAKSHPSISRKIKIMNKIIASIVVVAAVSTITVRPALAITDTPPGYNPAVSPSAGPCGGKQCAQPGGWQPSDNTITCITSGLCLTWNYSYVWNSGSQVPDYWAVEVTYTNVSTHMIYLPHDVPSPPLSSVGESMSGTGDSGWVSAYATTFSRDPGWAAALPPGGSTQVWAIFHNVPWPGGRVSLVWGNLGSSDWYDPYANAQLPVRPPIAP